MGGRSGSGSLRGWVTQGLGRAGDRVAQRLGRPVSWVGKGVGGGGGRLTVVSGVCDLLPWVLR